MMVQMRSTLISFPSLRNLTNDFGRLREGLTYDYGKPLLPFNSGHPVDCRWLLEATQANLDMG